MTRVASDFSAGGRYRKVFPRLWRNPDFRALDTDAKIVTLYLLSGPQTNRIGLFLLSPGAAAEDLGTTSEHFTACVERVCKAFRWSFDVARRMLWIPSWWKFNPLSENANNVKGYLADLDEVPPSLLISQFCKHLRFVPSVHHALFQAAAARYGVRTPSRHRPDSDGDGVGTQETDTETETEQEQETEQETASGASGAPPRSDVEAFVEAWNSHTTKPIPRCLEVSPDRRRKIAARLKERPLDSWCEVFDRIESSAFLRGENDRNWCASFDWIVKNTDNAAKVLEGRYDGHRGPAGDGLTAKGRRTMEAGRRYLEQAAQL
jgi:hypothetical protein